jgi:hypothetical protein
MKVYLTGALAIFLFLLQAFLNDKTTPKTDLISWYCLLIATAIWPLILPSMISKKWFDRLTFCLSV